MEMRINPCIEKLLEKAKETNETLYNKLNLVAMYERLAVDMYLLPDREDLNKGSLFLDQFKFGIDNTVVTSFDSEELRFALDEKDYNTIWYNYFSHIHFADSLIDISKNETFKNIADVYLDTIDHDGVEFEIDDDNHVIHMKHFSFFEDYELEELPTEYGWSYDQNTKTLSCEIPEIIIEDGIKSYYTRLAYIAQKIEILEDYFIKLHFLFLENDEEEY